MEEDIKYLSIRADLSYEGANNSYGLLGIIISSDEELIEVDLAVNYEHIAIENEYINIDLKGQGKLFREFLEERGKNYRSQIMKESLIESIDDSDLSAILEVVEEDNQKVLEIINAKLENIIKETIEMNLFTEFISEDELRDIYPELFVEEEAEEDDEESDNSDSRKVRVRISNIRERSTQKEDQDLEEVYLKCSPVVSPVAGHSISHLGVGDQIFVTITDRSDQGRDLGKMIADRKGKASGYIEKIDYKKEVERYEVLIRFRDRIYGQFAVGAGVKIESVLPKSSNRKDINYKQQNKSKSNSYTYILIALIIILISIAMIINL